MISKWSFPYHFLRRVNKSFNHDIGITGNKKVVGDTFYKLNFFLSQETCKDIFVDILRQRGCCSVGIYRVAAEGNSYRHSFPGLLPFLKVICTCLMTLPVHGCRFTVENLHPVHTDIFSARNRMNSMNHWKSYKPASVMRPAFENRKN